MAVEQDPDTNTRAPDDTIAGTGPGIPDDVLAHGERDLPEPPSDDEVAAISKALNVEHYTRKDV